jgi:hypothetical protein
MDFFRLQDKDINLFSKLFYTKKSETLFCNAPLDKKHTFNSACLEKNIIKIYNTNLLTSFRTNDVNAIYNYPCIKNFMPQQKINFQLMQLFLNHSML